MSCRIRITHNHPSPRAARGNARHFGAKAVRVALRDFPTSKPGFTQVPAFPAGVYSLGVV